MSRKHKNGVAESEIVPAPVIAPAVTSAPAAPVAPVQAPIQHNTLIREFTVPEPQQEPIRKADAAGAVIQKDLGSLELQYIAAKSKLIAAFEENRKEYERLLKEAGKAAGVDFDKLSENERWDFDFLKMTFKKVDSKG